MEINKYIPYVQICNICNVLENTICLCKRYQLMSVLSKSKVCGVQQGNSNTEAVSEPSGVGTKAPVTECTVCWRAERYLFVPHKHHLCCRTSVAESWMLQ